MVFEPAAVEAVRARARRHVDDATGESSEFGAAVVGLDAELFDRFRAWCQDDDIAVGRILHRDAIEKRRALIRRAAANLIVAGGKDVFAGEASLGETLRNDRRRERDQIEHVATVERQVLHGPAADDRAD